MKTTWTCVLALAVLLPLPALAQMRVAPAPTETRPVSLPAPAREADDNRRPQRVEEDKAESTAPARKPLPAATTPVYDSQGRRLHGVRQAGPNRVLDERTGRYHTTVPSGDGQRIVPEPAGSGR